jgi:hypothetical protein
MEDIEDTKLPKSRTTPQKYAKTAKQFANSRAAPTKFGTSGALLLHLPGAVSSLCPLTMLLTNERRGKG